MPDSTKVVRYGHKNLSEEEHAADGALNAGDLVETTANGVQSHATDGGHLDRVLVARESRELGFEVGDEVPTGDNVRVVVANAGVGVHLLLAVGETVSEGTRLVSAGNGGVRVVDQDGTSPDDPDTAVVAVAEEARDNSGGTEKIPVAAEVVR